MGKNIWREKLTDNLALTECTDGFYLYDYTRGMNLSMRAKTAKDALVEALTYYQKRTKQVESEYSTLQSAVNTFINTMTDEDEDEDE